MWQWKEMKKGRLVSGENTQRGSNMGRAGSVTICDTKHNKLTSDIVQKICKMQLLWDSWHSFVQKKKLKSCAHSNTLWCCLVCEVYSLQLCGCIASMEISEDELLRAEDGLICLNIENSFNGAAHTLPYDIADGFCSTSYLFYSFGGWRSDVWSMKYEA